MNTNKISTKATQSLLLNVLSKYIIAFVFIGLLIFIPAGTLKFKNGWIFIAGLIIPMTFTLVYLLRKDPELLKKRTQLKEKEEAQKKYLKLSILLFIIAYIIPGLDYRYHWSSVPDWLVIVSLAGMIFGYGMFIAAMLQNRYASRIIEIQDNQKLIDTGLYRIVRHPMYLAATILYTSSALVLGSYYTLIPMFYLPFLLGYRIKNEEKILMEGLSGYKDYMKRTRYRLIPYIW